VGHRIKAVRRTKERQRKQLFRSILALNVIPSITQGAFALLIVGLVIKLLRIRSHQTRIYLYSIPVVRSIIVFLIGIPDISSPDSRRLLSGFWLPDPLHLIRAPIEYTKDLHIIIARDIFPLLLLATLAITALILAIRWLRLVFFYADLSKKEEADRQRYQIAYDILDRLALKGRAVMPKLIVSDEALTPFTVGYKIPTVVCPANLLELAKPDQLEAILAHEMAHIKRRDYLAQWFYLLLRDLLFYNPALRLCLRKITNSIEFICDEIAVSLSREPRALAEALLIISDSLERISPFQRRRIFLAKYLYEEAGLLERVANIANFQMRGSPTPRGGRFWKRALRAFCYFLSVWVYFIVIINFESVRLAL
jgi:beta-lactamase regulating signal transducer with metallopeptidase domain